jgi:hypothetical protein
MVIIHVSLVTGGPCQVVGKQWERAHILECTFPGGVANYYSGKIGRDKATKRSLIQKQLTLGSMEWCYNSAKSKVCGNNKAASLLHVLLTDYPWTSHENRDRV